jgi:energy-coupling factor transporter ATP-binding protein EcfA2
MYGGLDSPSHGGILHEGVSDLSSENWLARLGFRDDPFFQDPVPPDPALKGTFIDREKGIEKLERFVSRSSGKLLIFGRTGEGKSSLLNLAQQLATQSGIVCIRIDGSLCSSLEKMLGMLLYSLQRKLEELDEKKRSQLAKAVKALEVEEVSEEERETVEGSVQGGLAGLIVSLKAKVGFNLTTGRTVVYRPKTLVSKEIILGDILPALFNQLRFIIIFDDTEKLQRDDFLKAVEAIGKLPPHALYMATANRGETKPSDMDLCLRVFRDSYTISPVDETSIGKFVTGRIAHFAIDSEPRVEFDPGALSSLFERTLGNLRDTFRYCYGALEACADGNKGNIVVKRQIIVKAIADKDEPIFAALDEADKILLAIIAKSGVATLDELEKESAEDEVGSQETIRRRLEAHQKSGLIRKSSLKKDRTHITQYSMPKVLIEAINLGKLLTVEAE